MKTVAVPENAGEREIYDLVIKTYQAYRDQDVETLKSLYPADGEQVLFLEGPQMKIVGWETFENFFRQFCQAYDDLTCTPAADFRFVRPADNCGFAYGTVIMLCREKATGFRVRWMDRTTICFVKDDSGWKMVHHHDSVPNSLAHIMPGPEEPSDGGYW